MNLNQIKTVYFLGIGGIGMSAIARYFNHIGRTVAGYDKTETPLTLQLAQEGMQVHYDDRPDLLQQYLDAVDETLVVLTPAIPKDHKEWAWFIAHGFTILKRSEVLGLLSQHSRTIGVAGTHGKTTTSTLVAHLLQSSAVKCNAFLGGISVNYASNMLLHPQGEDLHSDKQYTVVEADEFDRSFLTLHPYLEVITSTDADHLDIYGEHSALQESFLAYSNRLKQGGHLYVRYGLDIIPNLSVPYTTYGLDEKAMIHASNVRIHEAEHVFDLQTADRLIKDLSLGIPGLHNVENAVAACAVALASGVNEEELRNGLATFKGVKRRFEYVIKADDHVFIDDYAHHPEELKAILGSVKRMYPNRTLVAAFQPHLYSRTRDFAAGFSEALSMADQIFLLDIYPARELPIPGVDSAMLLDAVTSAEKELVTKQDLVKRIGELKPSLFLTLGAGDIDALVQPIRLEILK